MRGQKKTTNSHALNSDCVGGTTASSRRRLLGWKDGLCHVLIVPVKHFGVRLPLVRLAPSCANRLGCRMQNIAWGYISKKVELFAKPDRT